MTLTTIDGGDGIPAEPDWIMLYADELDIADAHEKWGIAVRELRDAGTLAVANGDAIKRLVDFRIQYERASRHVAEALLHNSIFDRDSRRESCGLKAADDEPFSCPLSHDGLEILQ